MAQRRIRRHYSIPQTEEAILAQLQQENDDEIKISKKGLVQILGDIRVILVVAASLAGGLPFAASFIPNTTNVSVPQEKVNEAVGEAIKPLQIQTETNSREIISIRDTENEKDQRTEQRFDQMILQMQRTNEKLDQLIGETRAIRRGDPQ